MIFGPIFRWECLAAARHSKTYAARASVGMVIGGFVGVIEYGWTEALQEGALASHLTSWMGLSLFAGIILSQILIAPVVAQGLFAGALADEADRKTLHDLLTTRLTAGEIVFDKMAARLLEIVGMLIVGLPFALLLACFSGVEPKIVWFTYPAILSTMFFIGSLAMFFSCLLLRTRAAIVATSAAVSIWLVAPPILSVGSFALRASFPNHWGFLVDFVAEINDWIFASNPSYPLFANGWLSVVLNPRFPISSDDYQWMISLQLIYASIFLLGAIFVLRRSYRRVLGAEPRRKQAKKIKARGIVGDAMFWKERRTMRGRGIGLAFNRAFEFGVVIILIWQLWEPALDAFYEQYRPLEVGQIYYSRQTFNTDLRYATFCLSMIFLIRVASGASLSIANERDRQTWTSLIATALDGWEILRGKILGAIWSQRFWAFALVILWAIGRLGGAIHSLGFLAGILSLCSFAAFASVLGVAFSLVSKTSKSANTAAAGILLLLSLAGVLVFAYLPETTRTVLWLTTCAPLQQSLAIISRRDEYLLFRPPADRSLTQLSVSGDTFLHALIGWVIGTFGYALAATILTIVAVKAFDRASGRPRRSRSVQRASDLPAELVENPEIETTPGRA